MSESDGRRQSLFGHLVGRFASSPEDLATEALQFILQESPIARRAVVGLASQTGADIPDDLSFRTQVKLDDVTRPDLVGRHEDGTPALVVEVKFWAGLTDAQPAAYLSAFEGSSAVLLFLVPEPRLEHVWAQICVRCEEQGIPLGEDSTSPALACYSRVGSHRLGIVSWRTLLNILEQSLAQANETLVLADLRQLRGLVDRMKQEAFIPFQSDDLAPVRGRKYFQVVQLVDAVTSEIERNEPFVSTDGLRSGGRLGSYGRYLRIHEFGCFLVCSPRRWFRTAETPLWLGVWDRDFDSATRARNLLGPLELSTPRRLYLHNDVPHIPLFIPTGREREAVIASLAEQIIDLTAGLASDT